jgi:hypothetical protein
MNNIENRLLEHSKNAKKNMMLEKTKHPYIFNSWRAIMYTKKGQSFGICDEWKNFNAFYYDVVNSYKEGLRFVRRDKSTPFSKDNFIWLSDSELSILKGSSIILEINGCSLTIKEWAAKSGLSIHAIKNRYHKYKDHSPEEIVFGIKSKPRKEIKDYRDCDNIRAKASKMCSSYRIKDLRKNLEYNLNIDWFIDNIFKKECIYCGDNKNIGCDRKDNLIGHIKSNVVPCCYTCNVVRNNLFSIDEMMQLGKVISDIKRKRIIQ